MPQVQVGRDWRDWLYEHAVNTAMLTVTVADALGFGETETVEAGLGAIFHDIGMLRIPTEVRMSQRALTEQQWLAVFDYPRQTIDTLDRMLGVKPLSKLIGFQVHERCDGSGYSRGRHRMFI